jgi:tRNA U34 2-thiouridine synthase MnmA/TrmU
MPPLYVIAKDVKQNILIVGKREQVMRREFGVGEVHWINQDTRNKLQETNKLQISNTNEQKPPIVSGNLHVRIRHGGELISAKFITRNSSTAGVQAKLEAEEQRIQATLSEYAFGVAAGQACVFYDDEVCLGGGTIL